MNQLMQHEMSIDRELQFMIKYQLTPEEYLLFKLIFLAQNEHEEYLNMFYLLIDHLPYKLEEVIKK